MLLTTLTSFLPLYSFYAADLFDSQEYADGSLKYDTKLAGKVNVSLISFVSSLVDKDIRTIMKIKNLEESVEYRASELERLSLTDNNDITDSREYEEYNKAREEYDDYLKSLSFEQKNRIAKKLGTPAFAKKLSVRFMHSKMLFSNKSVFDEQDKVTHEEFAPLYMKSIPSKIITARICWHLVFYGLYLLIAIIAIIIIITGIYDLVKYFMKKKDSPEFEYDDETLDPSFLFLLQGFLVLLLKAFFVDFSFGYGTILTMVLFVIYCVIKAVYTALSLPNKTTLIAFIKKQVVNLICMIVCICSLISLCSIGIGREIRANSERYEKEYTEAYLEEHLASTMESIAKENPKLTQTEIYESATRSCFIQMNKDYKKSHLIFEIAYSVAPFISLFLVAYIALRIANIKRKNEKNETLTDHYGVLAVILILLSCVPFFMKANTINEQTKDFESGKLTIILDDHTTENTSDYYQYQIIEDQIDFYKDLLDNNNFDEDSSHEIKIIKNEIRRYKKQRDAIGAKQTILLIISIVSAAALFVLELVYSDVDRKYRYAKVLGEADNPKKENESASA